MTAKHTPGPWTVLPYVTDGEATGAWFAYARGVRFLYLDGDNNKDEVSAADAALIAAAPELYEALSTILDECAANPHFPYASMTRGRAALARCSASAPAAEESPTGEQP
jgi:hypothetical protein